MARVSKIGIDYFPFNVDFFDDDKIALIESEFGIKGGYIAIRLMCKIYKEGYYYKWGADECLLFTRSIGAESVSRQIVEEVINGLVRRCFFDKGCFDRFGILTSKGIQNRYFSATVRYKKVVAIEEYLLIDVSGMKNVHINSINVHINSINAGIYPHNENENENEKKGEEEERNFPLDPKIENRIGLNSLKPLNEVFNELDNNQQWKEAICMNHNIPGSTVQIRFNNLKILLNEFYNHLSGDLQVKEKSVQDTYSHFSNWLRKKKEYERK